MMFGWSSRDIFGLKHIGCLDDLIKDHAGRNKTSSSHRCCKKDGSPHEKSRTTSRLPAGDLQLCGALSVHHLHDGDFLLEALNVFHLALTVQSGPMKNSFSHLKTCILDILEAWSDLNHWSKPFGDTS